MPAVRSANSAIIASNAVNAEDDMATLTIRNLDDALKDRLRVRAATRRRSMEEEVRQILHAALAWDAAEENDLGKAIQRRFKRLGGVTFDLPAREPIRKPPFIGS